MRTALFITIGLAAAVSGVPASFAHDSRVRDHGNTAGTRIEAQEPQTPQKLGNNKGISLDVPTGSVSVGPKSLGGEPVFVRRTVREGMTIVEVSTTPFMPVLASNEGPAGVQAIVRPDQPVGW